LAVKYITQWKAYYENIGQITPPTSGPKLEKGDSFGFPPLRSEVYESVDPTSATPGRLAWLALQDGDEDQFLDVYHAWIVEDMPWGVVRIPTQECQIGKPAAQLSTTRPNPMLNGHQEWLNGRARFAKDREVLYRMDDKGCKTDVFISPPGRGQA
jgi:hypothetical protein